MTDDLEPRLVALLERVAGAVDAEPDVDAVTAATRLVALCAEERPRRRRTVVPLAAAAAVLVGAVLVLDRPAGDPVASGSPAGAHERLPVVDDLPDDIDLDLEGQFVVPGNGNPRTRSSAVVARREGGALVDVVTVTRSDRLPESVLDGGTATTVGGQPATVVEWPVGGATLLFDRMPAVSVSGTVGIDLLADIADIAEAVDVSAGGAGFTIVGRSLPDGFVVVVPPTQQPPVHVQPMLSTGGTDVILNVEIVDASDPLLATAAVTERLEPVDVAGHAGWRGETLSGPFVVWEPTPDVVVVVSGHLDGEDILVVARDVRFVGEAAWRERYGVTDDPTDPALTATTECDEPGCR